MAALQYRPILWCFAGSSELAFIDILLCKKHCTWAYVSSSWTFLLL